MITIVASSSSNTIAAADQPKYGGTFAVAMGADPDTFNPSMSTGAYADQIGGAVFNNLLTYDENFNPRPDLAQSWQVSSDGLTYSFNLVKNATFHDGYPLTSVDVKFTYTQVLSKYHSVLSAPLKNVVSVDTPDNYTVVFRLSKPYAPFLYLLKSGPTGGILPAHLYSGTDFLTNKYNFAPIGSGPFKFAEWKGAEYIKLVKNEKYFKAGQPYLDQLLFKIIPDSNARVIALQNGDINYLWHYTVPYSAVPQLLKNPNLAYTFDHVAPASDVAQIILNLRNPILNNTDVRHALAYAINKTELVDKVGFGVAKEAPGPIPSSYGPSMFNPNLPIYAYDVIKANALLDKAGYAKGSDGTRFSLELTWPVENAALNRAGELLKSQLGLVGVLLKLAPADRNTVYDKAFIKWQYDLMMQAFGTGPLPDVGVARLSLSSNIGHSYTNNAGAYVNRSVDALWSDAATTTDSAKRTQDFYKLQEILVQDLPDLWLWEVRSIAIWSKDFAGISTPKTNWGIYDLQDTYWNKGTIPGQAVTSSAAPFPWTLVGGVTSLIIAASIVAVVVLRKRRK